MLAECNPTALFVSQTSLQSDVARHSCEKPILVSERGPIFAVSKGMCSFVLHTYIYTYTHSDFMDLSSVQRRLAYEIGHKEYWIVIYSLVLEINTNIIKPNNTRNSALPQKKTQMYSKVQS
jgi:hypothetical protein